MRLKYRLKDNPHIVSWYYDSDQQFIAIITYVSHVSAVVILMLGFDVFCGDNAGPSTDVYINITVFVPHI